MKSEIIYTTPELATDLDLTERTIRFYESKGLISPMRAGNTRIFNYKDRARLIIIRRSKKLGFSLDEIKKYLDLYDMDHTRTKHANVALKNIEEKLGEFEEKKKVINTIISELKSLKNQIINSVNIKNLK